MSEITRSETVCIDGQLCLDVRCDLSGCLKVAEGRRSIAQALRASRSIARADVSHLPDGDPIKNYVLRTRVIMRDYVLSLRTVER